MAGINYIRDEEGMRHLKVKEPDGYTLLAAGESITVGGFRLYLDDDETLKVTAVGVGSENIRIEPKSANCVVIHACS